MAEIDPKLREAKVAVEKSLLNRPGVTGVDIGYKEVKGRPTDTLAIRVLVEKKRDVPLAESIPQAIEGFPTDVIERKFELHTLAVDALEVIPVADTKEYPVLKGGISIGPCRMVDRMTYGGTLGALVTDKASGKPMALSNYHVLCVDRSWSPGDAIVQPSRIDGGTCPQSEVAVLKRGVFGGQVDCAVAELSTRQTDWEIIDIGKISGTNKAAIGETVRKRGRTTGLTYGIVDTEELSVNLDFGHGIGQIQLTNQIGIKPDTNRNAKFGDNGDSGSVILNDAGEVVGLYFAGDPQDPYGLANPIAAVLTALDVAIGAQASQPGQPSQPSEPTQPGQPSQPAQPSQPTQPAQPTQPYQPCHPGEPFLIPYPSLPPSSPSPFLIPYPAVSPLPPAAGAQ